VTTLFNRLKKRLKRRLRGIEASVLGERPINIAAEYAFLRDEPIGTAQAAATIAPRSINWIVPWFPFGAGGHLNIFRFVQLLEQRGFDCRIVVHAGPWFGKPSEVRKEICEWFLPVKAPVYIGVENAPPAYFTVATGWHTAYLAKRFQPTVCRCYFVQDFEPWFYPRGSDYALVEETYRLGLIGITDGDWLRDKLAADYGMETHSVSFSVDRRIHFPPTVLRARQRKKLLFYARPATERRGFELGTLVLAEVAKRNPGVEFVLVGAALDGYSLPFQFTAKGVVHPDLLGDLYRDCDLALVLSFSNLSLLPLELMACGVPVVSNRAPSTEWLLKDDFCCLVRPRIADLTAALCRLLDNDAERNALRDAGLRKTQTTSWEKEAEKMAAMFAEFAARKNGSKAPAAIRA